MSDEQSPNPRRSYSQDSLRERVLDTLQQNPHIFPSTKALAKNLCGDSSTLSQNLGKSFFEKLQIEWVRTSQTEHFLEALKSNRINSATERVREEIKTRLEETVKETLQQNPRIFPTPYGLAKHVGVSGRALSQNLTKEFFEDLQMEWIRTSQKKHLLKALASKQLNRITERVREEIKTRLEETVKETLQQNPHIFPSTKALANFLGIGRDLLIQNLGNAFFEDLQIAWVRNSQKEHFLRALSSNQLNHVTERVREKIKLRLEEIAIESFQQNPCIFPTLSGLAKLLGVGRQALSQNLGKSFFEDLQIGWVRTSQTEHFLRAFSSNQLIQVTGRVREEVNKRCEELGIRRCSATSSAARGGKLTMRQRIALRLASGGAFSPEEKEAYEKEEMFQLSPFRGAVALVKDLESIGFMSGAVLDFLSVGGVFKRAYSYLFPEKPNNIMHLDSLSEGESPSNALDDEGADLIVSIYSLAPIRSAKMLGAVVAEANRLLRFGGLFVATLPHGIELKDAHLDGLISLGFKADVFEATVSPTPPPLEGSPSRQKAIHKELWLFMEKVGPAEAGVALEPLKKPRPVVAAGATEERAEPSSRYLEREVIRSSRAVLERLDESLLLSKLSAYAKLLTRLVEQGRRVEATNVLSAIAAEMPAFTMHKDEESELPEVGENTETVFASIIRATDAFIEKFSGSDPRSLLSKPASKLAKYNKPISTKI